MWMTDLLEISASMPLRALNKLAARGITVCSVEKIGIGRLKIRVKSKDTKKIFAIFRGSCYTVTRTGSGGFKRILLRAAKRPVFIACAMLFCIAAAVSDRFVLRITVEGSGARYAPVAEQIVQESEIGRFRLFRADAAARVRTQLMQLPDIVFASVEKSGSVLNIVLEQKEEVQLPERVSSLVSTHSGTVEEITVLRGTALVKVGDSVQAGQVLVGGWYEREDGSQTQTFAVARAAVLCERRFEFHAENESEKSRADAVAAAKFCEGGTAVSYTAEAVPDEQGVVYTVCMKVRVYLQVNMGEQRVP